MRIRVVRISCSLSALIVLSSCSSKAMLDRIAPPAVDRYARNYVDTLATGTTADAAAQFTPRLAEEPGVMDSLRAVRARLAPFAPFDSVELVGARFFSRDGGTRRTLTYQLHGAGGWAIAQLAILDAGGQHWIEGVHIDQLPQSLEEANAFTRHVGLAQCLMLVWALAIAVFSLGTAVVVARTRMPHRWWWALAALVGVGSFGMNWTTGATFAQAISFHIPVAFVQRLGFAGPWLIGIGFPVGAIVALERRRKALRALQQPAIASPVETMTEASSETLAEASSPGEGT
ncbi:MAG TPA: hypothetical protein VF166_08600 [Gemmatimonadaceae bacterium]